MNPSAGRRRRIVGKLMIWAAAAGLGATAGTPTIPGAPAEAATATATTALPVTPASMRIDMRGAVAHVSVTRWLPCAPSRKGGVSLAAPNDGGGGGNDAVLDIALPERTALLAVEVNEGGRFQGAKPIDLTKGRGAYVESLRAMGLRGTKVPFDDEVRFRLRVGCRATDSARGKQLRYEFSTLVEMAGDRARIHFPASPELSPPATRVEVVVHPRDAAVQVVIAGGAHLVAAHVESLAVETVSTRAPWLVSVGAAGALTKNRQPSRLTGLVSVTGATAPQRLVAYALAAAPVPVQPLPRRVLFLVDRSRSVGPGGLEAERNLATRILDAMEPSTRFDALFFDRHQQRLFAVARTITRETIDAFEDQMVPSRLANGTDLVAGLQAAGDLLRREANEFSPRTLLVVLSDGAVGKPRGGNDMSRFLGVTPGVELAIAAISVRPNDDPTVSPEDRQLLRSLAAGASAGGVERTVRTGEIADAAPAVLAALRAGGDVHGVEITAKPADAAAPLRHADDVADVIPAGEGRTGVATIPAGPLLLSFHGGREPSRLRATPVDAAWLTPFLKGGLPDARLLIGPALAVFVEPVFHAIPVAAGDPPGPSGTMERSVVRDALSLAFTPRARACYLNRSARTPADRDLTGRVRLALDLVRGEVAAARVESSTLRHAVIEACLREAAFALDVPRAYRNDEPVTAVLNLVFRPRTVEPRRTGALENPVIANELDVLIEAALKQSGDAAAPADAVDDNAVSVEPALRRAATDAGAPSTDR